MKIISQQGIEADMTAFGVRQGDGKWAVTGKLSSGPFAVKPDYTIGVYGDKITAIAVMARIIQYEGAEPFTMPPEDTVMDL
ncbi:MAG: hypothetical protein LIO54_08380 [Oscillospiraceae bacterium]|nr:hypothetical protein [Oscillospiraceae bacterium]